MKQRRARQHTMDDLTKRQQYAANYYKKKKKEKRRKSVHAKSNLKRLYKMTEEEYAIMYAQQGGYCAICKGADPLNVDHDHTTGKVRGLLCTSCNAGLANFKDSVEWLIQAIKYLTRSNNDVTDG